MRPRKRATSRPYNCLRRFIGMVGGVGSHRTTDLRLFFPVMQGILSRITGNSVSQNSERTVQNSEFKRHEWDMCQVSRDIEFRTWDSRAIGQFCRNFPCRGQRLVEHELRSILIPVVVLMSKDMSPSRGGDVEPVQDCAVCWQRWLRSSAVSNPDEEKSLENFSLIA